MPPHDPNKLNRIEELKSKLFNKSYEIREHRDTFSHNDLKDVPEFWPGEEKTFEPMDKFFLQTSLFKKFFMFSLGFFVLAMGYASYMFFVRGNTVSSNNIEISVLGNSFTSGGEELSLVIGIINKNNSPLELVDLIIEYPKSSAPGAPVETERMRESLGTIPAGGTRNENVKMVLFGEQGTIRPIKISLEYRVEGSNAIFVKEKTHEVTISETPLNLSVDAPTEVSPNQEMSLEVKATLNSTRPAAKMLVKVDYPLGFQFISANPSPSLGNNVWNLGDLAPGAERDIEIEGKMLDVFDGEEKVFRITSGSQSDRDKTQIGTIFNSLAHSVSIKKPFIEARLYINGSYQKEYSSSANREIRGETRWVNNLDTSINDFKITARITGGALDKKSVKVNQGFYDSTKDTITWDRTSVGSFREVDSGDSGTVTSSFSSLSLFSTGGTLPNPLINIDVSISGRQELAGYSPKELRNSETKTVKIISDTGFAAKALYYSGPFKNSGSIPPKVGKKTTYTIVWNLSNTSNNISKAVVRSTLPPWMDFEGAISPSGEALNYNSSTKEITWNAGNIPKGAGVTGPAKEVAFQISFTPSLSQVGTAPVIINDSVLTGHDDFANVDIRVNKASLNTHLGSDPAFPSGGVRVGE